MNSQNITTKTISLMIKENFSGISISIIIGLAAMFLSEHYGAPVMLFALLLGIAMSFLYQESPCKKGIDFVACTILRVGVALLGLRIALTDLSLLGWQTVLILFLAIVFTILFGILLAQILKLNKYFGMLTGGSVAICGASAAMAITAILPEHKYKERDTLLTVIGVTSLSTIAMVIYPILATYLGLDNIEAGLFLGGTIHDVAQVVGAGYSISQQTGDLSTLIKLVRVSFLMPVVMIMLLIIKHYHSDITNEAKTAKIPLFLIAFVGLMLLNSLVKLPVIIIDYSSQVSRFLLVIAVAAIGIKSNLTQLSSIGIKPIFLMIFESIWLAIFILLAIKFCL